MAKAIRMGNTHRLESETETEYTDEGKQTLPVSSMEGRRSSYMYSQDGDPGSYYPHDNDSFKLDRQSGYMGSGAPYHDYDSHSDRTQSTKKDDLTLQVKQVLTSYQVQYS